MNPLKSLIGSIHCLPSVNLHILLTDEDDVIVARCLDFSISSHGTNVEEAIESLNDSIIDYVNFAINRNHIERMYDQDEDIYWKMYYNLQMNDNYSKIKNNISNLSNLHPNDIVYA